MLTQIEKEMSFVKNSHLGYLTSCPTNLGTCMTITTHVQFSAKMQNELERVQQIVDKYNIKMVAVSEHTPGAYELNNTVKLGRSEVDLVQDMYDCLLEINKAEYGPK